MASKRKSVRQQQRLMNATKGVGRPSEMPGNRYYVTEQQRQKSYIKRAKMEARGVAPHDFTVGGFDMQSDLRKEQKRKKGKAVVGARRARARQAQQQTLMNVTKGVGRGSGRLKPSTYQRQAASPMRNNQRRSASRYDTHRRAR